MNDLVDDIGTVGLPLGHLLHLGIQNQAELAAAAAVVRQETAFPDFVADEVSMPLERHKKKGESKKTA